MSTPRTAADQVYWSIERTPIGCVLVAASPQGVRRVSIGAQSRLLTQQFRSSPAGMQAIRDDDMLASTMSVVQLMATGQHSGYLPTDVSGTPFQVLVWEHLRTIPRGDTRTYSEVAGAIGKPKAVRAVARACATNPTALVVPCHRVIRQDGDLAGYRWGVEVKRRLLLAEQS